MSTLFFSIFFAVAVSGYAEEAVEPKKEETFAESQKKALEQWKKMRQDSSLSETAGEKGVLSELAHALTQKSRKVPTNKAAKAATKKNADTSVGKLGESVTEKAAAKVNEKVAEKITVQPKSKKSKTVNKKENPGITGTAKSPDGTTRTEY